VNDQDHVQGPESAPVTLVEYADYQCPYCGAADPIVKALQRELGESMSFVFRNFPLTNSHEYALIAAEAAEAAGAQGKFWEMHDTLFEHQRALDPSHLIRYARDLGLDVERFERDLEQHTFVPRIQADFDSGVQSGVQGTPTFFVNGRLYQGSYDHESLREAIADAARS
jgi:protein-disulfide isomerase